MDQERRASRSQAGNYSFNVVQGSAEIYWAKCVDCRSRFKWTRYGVANFATCARGDTIAHHTVRLLTECQTFVSARHESKESPALEGVQWKPDISHFTTDAVVYRDGTTSHVDTVLLGTGYEIRKPFLDAGNVLVTNRSANSNESFNATRLITNTHYLFPLHQHIFSLSCTYPLNALAFIGLPSAIANCPSDIAQALYVTHAIVNSTLLPSRTQLLEELAEHEDKLRGDGYDPYSVGHILPAGTASDYQDELISYLQNKVI